MPAIKIFSVALTASYFLLLAYFILKWIKEKKYFFSGRRFSTFASVIIPVRNEKENIANVLKDMAAQNYPRELFEIIVADDSSEDGTSEKAGSLQPAIANLRLIKPDKNLPGKKNAIIRAIDQSRGELIITTDADCRMGKDWLSALISFYEEKKPEMIIAPVCFYNETSFFDKLQSLEFLSLGAITGASAIAGMPLMCNGANLAYTKKSFLEVKGFAGNEETPSGDDILLMIKFKTKFPGKIKYLKSPEAAVFTRPSASISDFINQRKRWVSKNRFYSDPFIKSSSWLILLFNLSIPAMLCWSMVYKGFAEILLVSLSVKFFIDFLFLFLAASFFGRKSLLWLYFPAQVLYIFYIPVISVAGITGNFTWKGRLYK